MAPALSISNPQPQKLPGPELLHDLICQGGKYNDKIALEYSPGKDAALQTFTYEELHRSSNILAHKIVDLLLHNTASPQQQERLIIPLMIPQCPDLYISQLAILKAGGAFCPIPLDAPEERLRFILNDIGAGILLTHRSLQNTLPHLDNLIIIPIDELNLLNGPITSPPSLSISPSSTAYVMYTSGSTGQPKGVLLSHSSATQSLLSHNRHLPPFSRFLQFASPTFDVSVFEIFFPLFRGATLISCNRTDLLNDLPGCISRLNIDAAELTPSVASSLLRTRDTVPGLKLLLTIGEMLKPSVVQEFGGGEDQPGLLYGMYGPTEATIHCTLQPEFQRDMPCGNIGIPLDTVSAFVVRPLPPPSSSSKNTSPAEATQEVEILPIGHEGELAIGGHQLADGYLNRDTQTQLAFITHPTYGRLYRTGDRAVMHPDGHFDCLGRISSGQVKLRGQRIELGEIEHAAGRTPGCRDVVAEVVEGILVVFIAFADDAEGDGKATAESVTRTCGKWLPSYMIPGDVVKMGKLPYLPSGKVDRKGLREGYVVSRRQRQEEEGDCEEEEGGREMKRFVDDIGEIVGVKIKPKTSLASLGLDSISSIKTAAALSKRGWARIDATRFLTAKTVRDLFRLMQQQQQQQQQQRQQDPVAHSQTSTSSSEASTQDNEVNLDIRTKISELISTNDLVARHAEDIATAYPCTATQAAMLNETLKDRTSYCNWIELHAPSSYSPDDVLSAIKKLSQVHELLRSGFVQTSASECRYGYAVVVWKEPLSSQVVITDEFNHDFQIDDEKGLLHPCSFQISRAEKKEKGKGEGRVAILLKIHHALYDQWSIDILRSDLARLLKGEEIEAAGQFSAVSAHHASAMISSSANDGEAEEDSSSSAFEFWQDYLKDLSPTSLPLLRAQKATPCLERTQWIPFSIHSNKLRARAKQLNSSTPSLFQSALAILLSSYTGTSDITFGSVFSGRNIAVPSIERIFGPCLATLPFRVELTTARTCSDLLQAITDRNRAIQEYVLTSPADVKKAAGIAPGVGLFDTLFVWQESSVDSDPEEEEERVEVVDEEDKLEFNLVVEFEPVKETVVKARAMFQRSVIAEEQVMILLRQIEALVEVMMQSPEVELDKLAARLPESLLSISNPVPVNAADKNGRSLVEMIELRARSIPSSPAIAFARSLEREKSPVIETITFAELDAASNRAANAMLAAGLQTDELVCICMEKSVEFYTIVLATLKAGAGYLPLIPETPISRVESVLSQSWPTLCIVDTSLLEQFRGITDAKVLDTKSLLAQSTSTDRPDTAQNPGRIAYAVYTSGSTGTPKGVAVTISNLHGNLATLAALYNASPGIDRLLQSCSQAFDVSVFEIFFSFYTGICLCSSTKDVLFADFSHSIRVLGATHLSLTPTVAALVEPDHVPNVKFLVTAGEAVTEKVHRSWAGRGLNQGYGPSETTNICSVNLNVTPDDVLGNIGPVFGNTSAFVVFPDFNPSDTEGEGELRILPAGSYGEYAFGGEQVFRGYIGMDELNRKKIVNHPKYGRVYRSGDMGRILSDGTLLISGRIDDQVKIRGNRVELGEINAVVMRKEEVRDCATLVVGERSEEQALVTFWVPREGGSADADADASASTPASASASASSAEEDAAAVAAAEVTTLHSIAGHQTSNLFSDLENALPAYMLPSFLIPLTKLPLTTQGKLDKRHLTSLFASLSADTKQKFTSANSGVSAEDDDNEAMTPTESAIARALARVLQVPVEKISRQTSFFGLGLNSLNAIMLAKELQLEFERGEGERGIGRKGLTLGVSAIMRNYTISRLARYVAASQERSTTTKTESRVDLDGLFDQGFKEKIEAEYASKGLEVERILPCTPLQEAMLSASAGSSRDTSYSNVVKLRVSGDMDRLISCWETLVKRHEVLRTGFVQTQLKEFPYAQVVVKSVSGVTRNGNDDGEGKDAHIDHARPFRLVVDRKSQLLYLHMHHAIYDGISMANISNEIEQLYADNSLSEPISFEPFLQEVISQNQSSALRFWKAKMRNFTPHPFKPLPHPSSTNDESTITSTIPSTSSSLSSFCSRHSLTPLSLFQTAWAKSLSLLQSISDISFGNVVSGRTIPIESNISNLIFPCFNTIPIRISLAHIKSNLDLARSLHRYNLSVAEYQLTGLRRIQKFSTRPEVHLFDSLMLLQPPREGMEKSIWEIETDEGSMGLPLVVEITPVKEEKDGGIEVMVHYLRSKVPEEVARQIPGIFEAALKSVVQYPLGDVKHLEGFDAEKVQGRLAPAEDVVKSADEEARETQAEWSAAEKAIRQVFSGLSQAPISRIKRTTSLYQLGLDSLNAVQVASEMRKQGMKVDVADVMRLMTPAALAAFVGNAAPDSASPSVSHTDDEETDSAVDFTKFEAGHRNHIREAIKLQNGDIEAIRPCTAAQSGMLSQSLHSHGRLYVNHLVLEIPEGEGNDTDGILRAWGMVQKKHQILRVGFHQLENAASPFAMVIYSLDECPSSEFEFSIDSEEGSQDDIEQAISADIIQRLNLPAWRVSFTHEGRRKMCLSIHHALYDADSLELILADFAGAISKEDIGPISTIDQVLADVLDATSRSRRDEAAFWERTMAEGESIRFPNLTPTVVTSGAINSIDIASSSTLSDIQTFCKKESLTIQAFGQSIWASLLAAYLGESRIVFGTVLSGHNSSISARTAFPTITTIPVVCDASKSVIDITRDMVSYNSALHRYRFTPLTDIQRYAGRAGRALFDTVFAYQKSKNGAGERQLDWNLVKESAAVDYTVSMELAVPSSSSSEEVRLRLTYDENVIPQEHAALMVRQYDLIMSSAIHGKKEMQTDPFSPLISAIAPKEREIAAPVALLHEFVERGAEIHPDKTALEFIYSLDDRYKASRKQWTYRELNDRANQVAQLIASYDVKPGNMIAVCMTKSPEATFAFIGVLKAGCAFLAMDPELPIARKRFIVEDSRSKILFIDPGMDFAEVEDLTHNVECTESNIGRYSTRPVCLPKIDPSATSYCLYTSGTTGTPKGCELTHSNAVQAMMSFQRLFSSRWTSTSRWLQFASYWFDVSILEQFWSWSVGITLVSAPRDLVLEDLTRFLRTAQITHLDLTPSLARLVTPHDAPSLCGGVFITGGEALKQDIIDAWGAERTVCNGYGPTEATIGVTMNPFIGKDAKPTNIGPCFDNVGAFVLVPGTDEEVMRGAVGELCVFGKLVGKGYLNRPDLTERAFPYLERHGERVYRTGDLVRMLADGSFAFIGRKDTQAKLRGQRLEIDEIDAVINSASEEVTEVASLVVKSGENGRETLVSFIVPEGGKRSEVEVDTSTPAREIVQIVDEACRGKLPGYMVPSHIIPISKMPLTVNNKVDTKRLIKLFEELTHKELQGFKQNQSQTQMRELNEDERRIADVISRMLSIQQHDITPSSNIFSLGLSSVSAISFTTMLKRNGFAGASVANVMANPTIAALAKTLTDNTTSSANNTEQNAIQQAHLSITAFSQRHLGVISRTLSLRAGDIESISPCTALQEGLLVESMKSSSTQQPLYFNHFTYELSPVVDLSKLETALHRLNQEISILRTRFVSTDEGHAQVILRSVPLDFEMCALKQDESFDEWHAAELSEWVEVAKSKDIIFPFRARIAKTGSGGTYYLVLFAHHAIYDGISWELMMDQLMLLYEGRQIDPGPRFSDALAYGPLTSRPDAKAFWHDRLGNAAFVPLFESTSRDTDSPAETVSYQTEINHSASLETTRKQLGISHQAIFQAAFTLALHQLSPHTRTFGNVVSGRSIPFENAENVIGPLFNTLPYSVDLLAEDTWSELLSRCQETNAAVLPYQHTPLREIRKFCGRKASDPLFDVLFVFQQAVAGDDVKGVERRRRLMRLVEGKVDASFPLSFEVEMVTGEDEERRLRVTAVARHESIGKSEIEALVGDFEKAVRAISESVGDRVKDTFAVRAFDNAEQKKTKKSAEQADLNGVSGFEWTPEAKTIRGVIASLIGCGIDAVDEHASIYTLGLDSIDAVKLSARLRKENIVIPVSKILQAQTIPRMLALVDTSKSDNTPSSDNARLETLENQLSKLPEINTLLNRHDIERVLPAAPGQEAMIADMLRSNYREYFNHDILRLRDDVDIERLRQAWERVIHASPIWRTSFIAVTSTEVDVVFAQVVHRPSRLDITPVKFDSLERLKESLESIRADIASKAGGEDPPFRLTLAYVGGEKYLVISVAHAQYDGHSLALLHEDVNKAYNGGGTVDRPGYDTVINASLESVSKDAVSFWQDMLTGAQITHLGKAPEDLLDGTLHRAERVCSIHAQDARSLCQKLDISMQSLAQTAFALLLAYQTKTLDVTFGVVLACRDSEETEQVMFPTMNTVPMRVSLHDTGEGMLRHVQTRGSEILPYQLTPLRTIQGACSGVVKRTLEETRAGLFDALFIYQHRPSQSEVGEDRLYESVDSSSSTDYPLAMELEAVGEELHVRVACKGSLMSKQTTEELLERFDTIMASLVKDAERPAIEFKRDEVSILGLPGFKLKDQQVIAGLSLQDSQVDGDRGVTDPTTATICKILTDVSKSPSQVDEHTAMDSIGIDSILAIKVSALLRKQGVKISVSEMLKAKTASKMASAVHRSSNGKEKPTVSSGDIIASALRGIDVTKCLQEAGIAPSDVESILPATAGQVYMLSLWRKTNGQIFYSTFEYALRTNLDVEAVQKAWQQIVNREAILRTSFISWGSASISVLQVVLANVSAIINTDGNNTPEPLIPVRLSVSPSNTGFSLKLTIHHALYDAVSLPILMHRLQALLNCNPFPQPSLAMQDYIALSLTQDSLRSRLQFWTNYLKSTNQITLPQPAHPGQQDKTEIFHPRLISSASGLLSLAKQHQLSVQSLLFASYAIIHFSLSLASSSSTSTSQSQKNSSKEKKDVVIGIYLANRSHLHELDQLPAPTLNLVPLRVRNVADTSTIDLAREIQADLADIGSSINSAVSLAEIAEWTGVKVDTFVNFLRLPEATTTTTSPDEEDGRQANPSGSMIRPIEETRLQPRNSIVPATSSSAALIPNSPWARIPVHDAYQHAVDIEMTLTPMDDGEVGLDIGVFAPVEMCDLHTAQEKIVDGMRVQVGELLESVER